MTEPRKKGDQECRYSDAFKREAESPLTNTRVSAADVSAELGISVGGLWRWRKELAATEPVTDAPKYDELVQEVHRLKTENDFLKESLELLRLARADQYPVIKALEGVYPVRYMCTTLKVSRSKYYGWRRQGGRSQREREDRLLGVLIWSIHAEWDRILGYRRTRDVLRTFHGEQVGAHCIRQLMQEGSLWRVPLKKRRNREAGSATRLCPISSNGTSLRHSRIRPVPRT